MSQQRINTATAQMLAALPFRADAKRRVCILLLGSIRFKIWDCKRLSDDEQRFWDEVAGVQPQGFPAQSVVHEMWFCPELKIVILETNDDPRSGTWINELISIVRGEPDVTKYRPPADYVIRHVRVPAQ